VLKAISDDDSLVIYAKYHYVQGGMKWLCAWYHVIPYNYIVTCIYLINLNHFLKNYEYDQIM
jgi:hypothetical protein